MPIMSSKQDKQMEREPLWASILAASMMGDPAARKLQALTEGEAEALSRRLGRRFRAANAPTSRLLTSPQTSRIHTKEPRSV